MLLDLAWLAVRRLRLRAPPVLRADPSDTRVGGLQAIARLQSLFLVRPGLIPVLCLGYRVRYSITSERQGIPTSGPRTDSSGEQDQRGLQGVAQFVEVFSMGTTESDHVALTPKAATHGKRLLGMPAVSTSSSSAAFLKRPLPRSPLARPPRESRSSVNKNWNVSARREYRFLNQAGPQAQVVGFEDTPQGVTEVHAQTPPAVPPACMAKPYFPRLRVLLRSTSLRPDLETVPQFLSGIGTRTSSVCMSHSRECFTAVATGSLSSESSHSRASTLTL